MGGSPPNESEQLAWLVERANVWENALRFCAAKQPEAIEMIRSNGFVFRDLGNEPGNWQHLAFTLYNDLCHIETVARQALEYDPEDYVRTPT
jgi:hypothetical protein